jgi:colanic acid/amylovoran biosynthesis glycosyltransferase
MPEAHLTAAPLAPTAAVPGLHPGARDHAAAGPAQRLRIAYLVNKYPFVSHTFIRREIHELERRGHEVVRLSIRDPGSGIVDARDRDELGRTIQVLNQPRLRLALAQVSAAAGSPVGYARALRAALAMARRSDRGMLRHAAYLAEAAYIRSVLQREGVQHIHAHFATNSATVARLVYLMGGPTYSMTSHGAGDLDAPIGYSIGEKIQDAAFVIAISDHCATQLKRWVPWEQWPKIHVVRCTVGEEFFQAAAPIDPASRTLVCVGRLATEKGHLALLEGFAMALRRGVDARLVLAGDGELRGIIERRITDLGLSGRVEITGWIDEAEVRRRLLAARGLVMASFNEGLPMVIMEAMALGRPVIATTITGIPELVRPGENGWLVTPGRADRLADAIGELMGLSVAELEEMAQRGRELVRQQHYTPTEGEKLEQLLLRYVPAGRAGG